MVSHDAANSGQAHADNGPSGSPSPDPQRPPFVSANPLARYHRTRPVRQRFSKKVAAVGAVLAIVGLAIAIMVTNRRSAGGAAPAKPGAAVQARSYDAEKRILGETDEADAPRRTLRIHNAMVRVTRVEVGEVRGRDEKNQVITSDGKTFLHVFLRVQNVGTLPLEYHSWYGNAFEEAGTSRVAELRDDAGRTFDMMLFSDTRTIRGHVAQAALAPRQSIQDVLIFRLPEGDSLSRVSWLSLRLPALAHGDAGGYRFRIPRSMIVAADSTAQSPAVSEAGEPDENGGPDMNDESVEAGSN